MSSDRELLVDEVESPEVLQLQKQTPRRIELLKGLGLGDLGIDHPASGPPLDPEFCKLTAEMMKHFDATAAAFNLFFDQQYLVGLSEAVPNLFETRVIPLGVGMCPKTMGQTAVHLQFDLQGMRRFADTVLTAKPVYARAYGGKRMVVDPKDEESDPLGTACVVRRVPTEWSRSDVRDFKDFARQGQELIYRRQRRQRMIK